MKQFMKLEASWCQYYPLHSVCPRECNVVQHEGSHHGDKTDNVMTNCSARMCASSRLETKIYPRYVRVYGRVWAGVQCIQGQVRSARVLAIKKKGYRYWLRPFDFQDGLGLSSDQGCILFVARGTGPCLPKKRLMTRTEAPSLAVVVGILLYFSPKTSSKTLHFLGS